MKALKNFALEKLIKNKIQEATSKQQLVFAPQNPWIVSRLLYRCQVIYNYKAFLKSSFSRVEDYKQKSHIKRDVQDKNP